MTSPTEKSTEDLRRAMRAKHDRRPNTIAARRQGAEDFRARAVKALEAKERRALEEHSMLVNARELDGKLARAYYEDCANTFAEAAACLRALPAIEEPKE